LKLIIQIPCFNEETTLEKTFKDLPREIDGINHIEYLMINDGSRDDTVRIAREIGFDHIIDIPTNKGLANAFMAGLNESLKKGADIIVNTDADNQYVGKDISRLVQPIISGEAEVVIGVRDFDNIKDFSWLKKQMEKLGSFIVSIISGLKVPDATSGFRAFSRDAALKINIISKYTYTLESLIQMGRRNISVISVPINVNEKQRESRLVKSIFNYILRSFLTITRIFIMYKPLRFFSIIATIFFTVSITLFLRFSYFFIIGLGDQYIKSLITGGVLITLSLILLMVGLLSDIISSNRVLLEELLYKVKKIDYGPIKDKSRKIGK
jgi:glycosyltransferase involved in cell wall biosynthesis